MSFEVKKKVMKLFPLFSLIILFCFGFIKPEENKPINLKDAVAQKLVQTTIEYAQNATHYGKSISIMVFNISKNPISVAIPNGELFEPTDPEYQNMVVTDDAIFVLKAGEAKRMDIYAMCTEPQDRGAQKGVTYKLSNTPDSKLKTLTQKLHELKALETEGQYAVWALMDKNRGLETVYGSDTTLAANLRTFLSALTGKKLPDPSLMTNYASNYYSPPSISKETIRGNFDFNYSNPKNICVGMFNTSGTLVRELYREANVKPGFKKINFEFDSQTYTDDVYNFYLIADGKIDLKIQIKPNEIRKKAIEQSGQH